MQTTIPLDADFPGVTLEITQRPDLAKILGLADGAVPQHVGWVSGP